MSSKEQTTRAVQQGATGQEQVSSSGPRPDPDVPPAAEGNVDRGLLILQGLRGAAAWAWRFLLVIAALAVILYVLGKAWVGVLPLLLALIVTTVLYPPTRWLKGHRWSAGVAAISVLVLALTVVLGSLAAIAPGVVAQGQVIARQAAEGLQIVNEWLAGPPFNLESQQISEYVDQASSWLHDQSSDIASGILSGVSTAGSVIITLVLVLVLTFFFLKDGDKFLPWLRRYVGPTAGMHLTESLSRLWVTLGGFIRAQAMVSLVDAVFIGLGLVVLGVPMAFALALITFFAGFIPIVGALTAGTLAVLVALVSEGFTTAVWVLVIVLVVQQLEGNVLQPVLQSRAMNLHPVIILLVVAAGGTRWGIVGAFLAVPVTAALVSLFRYGSEHLDLRTGTLRAQDVRPLTPEGRQAAELAEEAAPVFQLRARQAHEKVEHERGAARRQVSGRTGDFASALKDRMWSAMRRRDESGATAAAEGSTAASGEEPDPEGGPEDHQPDAGGGEQHEDGQPDLDTIGVDGPHVEDDQPRRG